MSVQCKSKRSVKRLGESCRPYVHFAIIECIALWSAIENLDKSVRARMGLQGTVMNKPEFFVTPSYGERQLKLFCHFQAVKVGNRVETSGQEKHS